MGGCRARVTKKERAAFIAPRVFMIRFPESLVTDSRERQAHQWRQSRRLHQSHRKLRLHQWLQSHQYRRPSSCDACGEASSRVPQSLPRRLRPRLQCLRLLQALPAQMPVQKEQRRTARRSGRLVYASSSFSPSLRCGSYGPRFPILVTANAVPQAPAKIARFTRSFLASLRGELNQSVQIITPLRRDFTTLYDLNEARDDVPL
jgi:hypothetical protein